MRIAENMKNETKANKLNALLGLTAVAEEIKTKVTGKVMGVSEKEIQSFRAAQGLLYFLQAPELFSARICTHCSEPFLVSRKYVAYCSYECIRKSLEDQGIKWRKGYDLESLALDPQVYDGNEPIWIPNSMLVRIEAILDSFKNLESTPALLESKSELMSESTYTTKESTSSSALTTTSSGKDLPPSTLKASTGPRFT